MSEEASPSDRFFSYLAKYDRHIQLSKTLMNLKPEDEEKVFNEIIYLVKHEKYDVTAFYKLISIACERNLRSIKEYWSVFNQIYSKYQIRPNIYELNPTIGVIYAKVYNMKHSRYDLPQHLEKNQTLEEILNVYEPDSIMHCILHDDINLLINNIQANTNNFDFNMKIFDKNIIEWTCFYGSLQCFKFLQSNGAKITDQCMNLSISGKNKDIIHECLNQNKIDNETMKECIKNHDFEFAMFINNQFGISIPIDLVVDYLDLELFLYILSNSTNFDHCLIKSVNLGIPSLIDDIIQLGGDVNFRAQYYYGYTSLFYAALYNRIEIAKKLIELGANLDVTDKDGNTALIIAGLSNGVEVAAKLVEAGSNIEAKNRRGWTSLITAAVNDSAEVAAKLVELGADIECKDREGQTPLIHAAVINSIDVVTKLIELGADIEATDKYGKTALDFAVKYKSFEVESKLNEIIANKKKDD